MSVLNVPILSLNKSLKTVAIVFVFLQQKDSPRSLTMSGHVGFESLPDQLVNRSIQQGFCFNILCVGESAQPVQTFSSCSCAHLLLVMGSMVPI